MIAYVHPAFRPAYRPAAIRPRMAQQAPPPVTPGEIKGTAAGLGLVSTTLSAAAAWVGIDTGIRGTGLKSVAGWVVGLTGALFGAMSLFGTLGVLFTSEAELQHAIDETRRMEAPAAPAPARPSFDTSSLAPMPILREVA